MREKGAITKCSKVYPYQVKVRSFNSPVYTYDTSVIHAKKLADFRKQHKNDSGKCSFIILIYQSVSQSSL
jgi:hypothetical protein